MVDARQHICLQIKLEGQEELCIIDVSNTSVQLSLCLERNNPCQTCKSVMSQMTQNAWERPVGMRHADMSGSNTAASVSVYRLASCPRSQEKESRIRSAPYRSVNKKHGLQNPQACILITFEQIFNCSV